MSSNDMTEAEQTLADDERRALIAKLTAETFKLNEEGAKMRTERQWYLLGIGSAATLAIVAVTKLFL